MQNGCKLTELFENKSEDYILKFIAEYIQYWEYYDEFIKGYSKIVDVKTDDKFYPINLCSVKGL